MKSVQRICYLFLVFASPIAAAYEVPQFPYAPAAGQPGSTAVTRNDARIRGWAISVDSVEYGEDVADEWKKPDQALGPATATSEGVMVLGRGGQVVLAFEGVIRNGDGPDFAVFENALDDTFLELAFVEVSTDGVHFVRFPGYSVTDHLVGAFGSVQPSYVTGLAGKYRSGFGTPFDLSDLHAAHEAAVAGEGGFSDTYRAQLLDGFPYLDLEAIRFVRILDIAGDGREKDCEGFAIFDPYPTVITSGFDLDAVAVLNGGADGPVVTFSDWAQTRGLTGQPATDEDRDGWSDYLEYLLDSDPLSLDSKPSVRIAVVSSDLELSLSITYNRRTMAGSFPIIETSTDLTEWEDWTGQREIRTDPKYPQGDFVREVVSIPLTENAQTQLFTRFSSL